MILILILFLILFIKHKKINIKNIGNTNKYFPLLKSDLNLKYIISKLKDNNNNNNLNFDIKIGDISLNNISNNLKKKF